MTKELKKLVVVGGGTAGWMSAALLSRMHPDLEITLIESPDIPAVGVGEATIPPIVDFIRLLGIDISTFIKKTNATFKSAIRFEDWKSVGEGYWHQFGRVGVDFKGLPFYQLWLRSVQDGGGMQYTDFSPAIAMSTFEKFVMVPDSDNSVLSGSKFAWHFDAGLFAELLRDYSVARGVTHVRANVERASITDSGFIESLFVGAEESYSADFFIDCTGFKGALIEGALHVGYEDWSNFLPCDRAVVAQTKSDARVLPYTVSTALKYGWKWAIPLQNRMGNGYVYSSRFVDDETAKAEFLASLGGDLVSEPRIIRFRTGMRKKIWSKNCLAIGLSSGFLEPLESTSIHLIMKGISLFCKMLPTASCDTAVQNEYNRVLCSEYISIRDFIVLHYCKTQRSDTEFWRYCKGMNIPNSLLAKLEYFLCRGDLVQDEFDLFSSGSWYSVLEGMGVRPKSSSLLLYTVNKEEVDTWMSEQLRLLEAAVRQLPDHQTFLRENSLLV